VNEPTRRAVKAIYRAVPLKQPLFTALRRFPVPTRLMRHLRFEGIIDVAIDADHSFRMLNSATFVENDLFWLGYGKGWEGASLRIWRRLAPRARTILDIGANTGVYALAARCLNRSARIVAFEPIERVFHMLEDNIRVNGYDIEAEMLAVSDRNGAGAIYDIPRNVYVASLERAHRRHRPDVVARAVTLVRLDDYARTNGVARIDLVKIDVERHEAAVLRGFGGHIAASMPTMLVEVLSEDVAGEIRPLVAGLGYRMFRIVEGEGMHAIEDVRYDAKGRNLLLCREQILEEAGLQRLVVRA
jgi:FkbM family methyltransferase